jgi:hypothetical protein
MAKPPIEGAGALRVTGQSEAVAYVLHPPSASGRGAGKGSVTGEAEHMRAAFRAGRVMLSLDDGRQLPIQVTAHTEGGATAYFEY